MKKKVIQLAVVAVLLAGMVAALVFLRKAPPVESNESSAKEKIYAVGGESAPVPKTIDVQTASGDYTLVNVNPGAEKPEYTLKGWENLSLDSYGLGGAFTNAKALEAKRVVVENPESADLKAYGLDNPRSVVNVTPPEGESYAFQVGADAPGGEGAYIMNMQNKTVYLVSPVNAEPFVKPAVRFINPAITPVDEEQKGFDKLTLSGSDYPEPIVIERTPDKTVEAAGVTLSTHGISSPVKAGLDSQYGLTPLMSVFGLSSTEALNVGDDAETLEKYDLKEPACVVSVVTEKPETTFTLRISKPDADGNCTAIKSGSPVIYSLPASSMPWLGLSLFDMREKFAVMPFIDSVAEIELLANNKTYTFALEGEGKEMTATLDGKEIPGATKEDGNAVTGADNFRQFYQTLISARYDEEIPADMETEAVTAQDSGTPVVRIVYKYRDTAKPSDVVAFYPGPTRRVIITHNGGEAFYTQSAYVDRVCEDVEKLAAGQPVKSIY